VQELIAGFMRRSNTSPSWGGAAILRRRTADRRCLRVSFDRGIRTHSCDAIDRSLLAIPGLRFFGITDPKRFRERCSTVSFRLAKGTPTDAATFLGERGIFTWDG